MVALRASPNQDLLDGETKNVQVRRKKKGKEKMNTKFKLKEYFDPSDEALGSRKYKHQRFEKDK